MEAKYVGIYVGNDVGAQNCRTVDIFHLVNNTYLKQNDANLIYAWK
jgi:hypothetical protein